MLLYETHLPLDAPSDPFALIQTAYNWVKKHPVLQTAPQLYLSFRSRHGSLIDPIQCSLNPNLCHEIHSIRIRIPHPQNLPCDFIIDTFCLPESLRIQLKLKENKEQFKLYSLQTQIAELESQHIENTKNLKQEHERELQQIKLQSRLDKTHSSDKHFIEIKEKNQEISDLKRDIRHLERLLEEATDHAPAPPPSYTPPKTVMQGEAVLVYGAETDLYSDEIASFVLDALNNELLSRTHPNSRRQHILQDLLAANALEKDTRKEKENEFKQLMRSYQRMDAPTLNQLKKMGFSHSQDGTHHKLVFMNDTRYTSSTSKTSSDVRSGRNFSHDIANKLF